MPASDSDWFEANQADLLVRLTAVKRRLAERVGDETASAIATPVLRAGQKRALAARPSAFAHVTETFGLSAFEQEILLLCAGVEIDAAVPALCAAVQGDASRPYPTFGMALADAAGAALVGAVAGRGAAALAADRARQRPRAHPCAAADRRARAAFPARRRRDRRAPGGADRPAAAGRAPANWCPRRRRSPRRWPRSGRTPAAGAS